LSELKTFISGGAGAVAVDEATGEAGKDSCQMLILFDEGYYFIARVSTGGVEVW
jgi:hypothetical protein